MSYKDIAGQRFGRLVALSIHPEKYKTTKWLCRCDCGNTKLVPLDSLTSGKGISCGCYRKEVTSKHFKKHGVINKHLYSVWLNMRNRCFNLKSKSYKNYGLRGITVCEEWNDYTDFYNWSLNNGYEGGLTIDRINNDGNYEPSNCRWTTWDVQMNNTSKNVKIEINGELKTIAEHAKDNKLDYGMLYYRYEQGMQAKDLIKPSMKKRIIIEIDGVSKSLKAWSEYYEISYGTTQHRYKKGIRGKDLFGPVDPKMSAKAKKQKRESM